MDAVSILDLQNTGLNEVSGLLGKICQGPDILIGADIGEEQSVVGSPAGLVDC
jgi:hypothetical protein